MESTPRVRAALDHVPVYRAGRRAPPGAFKMSSNENPYPPLPGVVAAIIDAAVEVNRYPDFGCARLVKALAEHHDVSEASIALGTGSVAVLAQTIQAVATAGDEVVVPWRSFEAYPILVQLSGARLVTVPLRADHCHDLDATAAAVTDCTRLVMICSPNNPTGTIVQRAELECFLDRLPADVLVAIDEAYVEFVAASDRLNSLELVQERGNVMVLRTFSKAYGLAGLRIGYAIASEHVASALRKTQLPFGVSALAEQAALASLACAPQLLDRVRELMLERDRVVGALRQQGTTFGEPHGNFIWLPLGEDSASFAASCDAQGMTVRAFAGSGVRVTISETAANDRFIEAIAAFTSEDAPH